MNVSEVTSASIFDVRDEDNNKIKLNLNFIDREEYLKSEGSKKYVSSKMLDESNGYLKINSWSNNINVADLIEKELENISKCQSLVIDVRGNGGGNSLFAERLAGHFIKQPVFYGTIREKQDTSNTLLESKLSLEPQSEFLNKKVVILTDPKCLSSNELFIMMLKDTGVATTIGQTTGGGSGNPKSLNIFLGENSYSLNVSTWKIIRNNGKELENIGIEPDIQTGIKPSDVIEDHDIDLETAIKYLKESK